MEHIDGVDLATIVSYAGLDEPTLLYISKKFMKILLNVH